MGNPLNLSTTATLMMIIWVSAGVLVFLLLVLILRAIIKSAVLSALRKHSREQASVVRTVRLEKLHVEPRPDTYPFAPGMSAYPAATAATPAEPETAAFTPNAETVAFTPDEKPHDD